MRKPPARSRYFTPAELARASELRSSGKHYKQIARALGRRCGDGIKRRLDPAYREHRNAYHAAYRLQRQEASSS